MIKVHQHAPINQILYTKIKSKGKVGVNLRRKNLYYLKLFELLFLSLHGLISFFFLQTSRSMKKTSVHGKYIFFKGVL